jgi:hypothetical protein
MCFTSRDGLVEGPAPEPIVACSALIPREIAELRAAGDQTRLGGSTAMASTTERLKKFIASAKHFGLPVGFLSEVVGRYNFRSPEGQGTDNVMPTLNLMTVYEDNLRLVEKASPGLPIGEGSAINTVYHEATHAYFDLEESSPGLATAFEDAVRRLRGGHRKDGKTISDPERAAHETAGTYVGHRVFTWWSALERLTLAGHNLDQGSEPQHVAEYLADVDTAYDQSMKEKVFGYESSWGKQIEIAAPIPTLLRQFCDRELLEGKIPDRFAESGLFRGKLAALKERLAH